jgi:hypothetical protein
MMTAKLHRGGRGMLYIYSHHHTLSGLSLLQFENVLGFAFSEKLPLQAPLCFSAVLPPPAQGSQAQEAGAQQ